ncbi:MAG: IS66 family transposase [Proteobacteria bacterium]|nr:IS66 family transposase [Pseudomonadota bacterium]
MDDSAFLSVSPPLTEQCDDLPFAREAVVLSKQDYVELRSQCNFYKTQHERALVREAELKLQLAQEQAKVRDLNQRLYGRKSEQTRHSETRPTEPSAATRPRGQQPGSQGHGRTPRPHLPVKEEIHDLAEHEKYCVDCGLPYHDLGTTEDSEIVEIQVSPYVRKIRRKKYRGCSCQGKKSIITASPAPRVLNRNNLGVSVWVEILLDKYLQAQATHRWLLDFAHLGCPLSQGTVTGGLQRLAPLFEPVVDALRDKHLSERLFHADETGWRVFESIENKASYRWYLWVMQSPSVVYYQMAPGRDAGVPLDHFGGLEEGQFPVFLVCDRYSAYKKLARELPIIALAFCWAHVRRDFLEAARRWPDLNAWMFEWVEAIGELYHRNNLRLPHWEEGTPLGRQSSAFQRHHRALRKHVSQMKARCEACLQQPDLDDVQRAVLTSLNNHWPGLVLFAKHPQIPMDNNQAERSLRNAVTGRKRYYGSGRVWSAQLAALLFTVLQTVLLWDINPRHWLSAYLTDCADNGGQAPVDLAEFLPWDMTEARRSELGCPAPMTGLESLPRVTGYETRLFEDTG